MNTLDLNQAAAVLKIHPEEVRRRARLGQLPGAKPGKTWAFLEDDIAAYVCALSKFSASVASDIVKGAAKMSLFKRGSTWWIDFATPSGERVRRSAETGSKAEAQEINDRLKAESWRVQKLGERPK